MPSEAVVPSTAAEQASGARRWRVFAVVCLAVFIAQLDLFIVNIAFPVLQRHFVGTSTSTLSWVLDAYAIVFAACLVPAGRLADRWGRRRGFALGLAIFAVASALCAAAPSASILIGARALQAVGAALVIPTSLGLLLAAFPPAQRPHAVAAWSSVAALSAASGPPLGGLLVQASWRLIFLVNVPIAIVGLVGAVLVLQEVRHRESGGLPDLFGALLLMVAVSLLILAIVEGQGWGWGGARFLGTLLLSLIIGAGFLVRSARHKLPVLELSLLRERSLAAANTTIFCFYVGFGAMLLGSVLFLTQQWHESTIRAGLEIAPGPLTVAVVAIPSRRLIVRFGARYAITLGTLAFAAGGAWWATHLHEQVRYASDYLPGILAAGFGVGVTQAGLFGVVAMVLPSNRFATGNGLLNMCRQMGIAFGVAILVALLGSGTTPIARFERLGELMLAAGVLATLTAQALPGRAKAAASDPVADEARAVDDAGPRTLAAVEASAVPEG